MNWKDEETIAFIEMYRARSLLWDPSNAEYKNKNKRHDALIEIAISFGMEKVDVETKIKNLQTQFARERKKERDSRKTGTGADDAYISRWFAYPHMMFLADKNKPKNTTDTEFSENREEEKQDEYKNKRKVDEVVETVTTEDNEPSTSNKKTFSSPIQLIKKRKVASTPAANAPVIDEAVNLLKSIQSNRKEKDECQLFGEQVATKLRNLTSPQARFSAQQMINLVLFEAEMGMAVYSYSQPFFHQQTYPNMYPSPNKNSQNSQLSLYPSHEHPTLALPPSSSSFPPSQSSAYPPPNQNSQKSQLSPYPSHEHPTLTLPPSTSSFPPSQSSAYPPPNQKPQFSPYPSQEHPTLTSPPSTSSFTPSQSSAYPPPNQNSEKSQLSPYPLHQHPTLTLPPSFSSFNPSHSSSYAPPNQNSQKSQLLLHPSHQYPTLTLPPSSSSFPLSQSSSYAPPNHNSKKSQHSPYPSHQHRTFTLLPSSSSFDPSQSSANPPPKQKSQISPYPSPQSQSDQTESISDNLTDGTTDSEKEYQEL